VELVRGRPGPRRELTDTERYLFDLEGYIVRTGVLDAALVKRLNRAIDAIVEHRPDASLSSQRFGWLLDHPDPFDSLLAHPEAIAVLSEICGPTVRLDHAYGIQMRTGTQGLGLHGGATPHDPSQYYRWQDGRMWNGLVGVMWGLSPNAPGEGGFGCVPGSHKSNLEAPDDLPIDRLREVPLPPGSMLVFTEALMHCTMPWNGPTDRRVVVYKYAPGFMAWNPGAGYRSDLFGEVDESSLPLTRHVEARTGVARTLLHPPYEPYHPHVQN
jgi:hypothetical protein